MGLHNNTNASFYFRKKDSKEGKRVTDRFGGSRRHCLSRRYYEDSEPRRVLQDALDKSAFVSSLCALVPEPEQKGGGSQSVCPLTWQPIPPTGTGSVSCELVNGDYLTVIYQGGAVVSSYVS